MLMMVVEPSCAGFQESGTRKADESGEMKFRAFASGRTATKSKRSALVFTKSVGRRYGTRDSRAYRASTVSLTSKIKEGQRLRIPTSGLKRRCRNGRVRCFNWVQSIGLNPTRLIGTKLVFHRSVSASTSASATASAAIIYQAHKKAESG